MPDHAPGLPEVERKFDVDDDTRLPDLAGAWADNVLGTATDVELVAVYFDTSSADLARHGVTLRHRSGGSDEGWHLKVALGGDERRELRRPLAAIEDGPPATLLRVVRAALRGREAAPVARLTTQRTEHPLVAADGTVLAVVCDDRVTGTPAARTGRHDGRSWREWEVELVSGEPALLDDIGQLLCEAGARPAVSRTKLSHLLGTPVEPMGVPGASAGKDTLDALLRARASRLVSQLVARDIVYRLDQPESVHRLRIAVRRLRSLLTTCRPVLGAAAVDDLRAELRWFGTALSAERDVDVLRRHLLDEAIPRLPGVVVDGRLVTGIREQLTEPARQGHRAARRAMGSKRYLALLDRLEVLAAEPHPTAAAKPARSQARRLVRRDGKSLRRAMRKALATPPGERRDRALHEARKKARRVRYAAELAEPVVGRSARRLARAARRLQDVLGEHQDAVVAGQALRELVEADTAGSTVAVQFTLGRLYAHEQQRAEPVMERLAPAWRKMSAALDRWKHRG